MKKIFLLIALMIFIPYFIVSFFIKDENIKGLYFIGSSTHPGNGVSVIIDGSKIVADEIYKEYK